MNIIEFPTIPPMVRGLIFTIVLVYIVFMAISITTTAFNPPTGNPNDVDIETWDNGLATVEEV